MDYNAQPWIYEVVGINGPDHARQSFYTDNKEFANEQYDEMKMKYQTVLLAHSRKGMVKGQYE